MVLDNVLLDALLKKASESGRLRVAHDLRTSCDDNSQRMLNALLPGTVVPIHRHPATDETLMIVRGSMVEVFYDEEGKETNRFVLNAANGQYGVQVPAGQWHSVIVTEPCVILEIKDGKYVPVSPDDVMDR